MNRKNHGLYPVALAIVVIGALWAGVPAGTLVLVGVFLACPLMMMFMMRSMHGGGMFGDKGQDQRDALRQPGDPDHHGSLR